MPKRLHAAHAVRVGVQEHHALVFLREHLRHHRAQRRGAVDQPAVALATANPRERDDHGAQDCCARDAGGDHGEDQRSKGVAALDPVLAELEGEERGDGCSDDPARRDRGQGRALGNGEVRAVGAQRDSERPHQERERRAHDRAGPAQRPHVREAHVSGQEHEEGTDEDRDHLLFELGEDERVASAHTAHDEAGGDHRGDAALRQRGVGRVEEHHDQPHGQAVAEALGDRRSGATQERDERPSDQAQRSAGDQATRQRRERQRDRLACRRERDLERDGGSDGPERVSEHALGLEHGRDPAVWTEPSQERTDDGGTGDDDQRAEGDREAWVPAQHVVRERGGGDRGERSANAQEPADRPLGAAHAIEIQREPALEEDQRDGDANEDLQARSELGGTDQIGAIGTEQHAGREHQDEAREAQRARQDLRSDAGAERQRDGPADGVVVSFHSLLGSRRAPRADPLGGSARADGGVSAPSRRGPGGSRGTRGRAPRRA